MQISTAKIRDFSPFFIIVVVLLIFNILALKSAILGLILGVFWLVLFMAGVLGAKFWPSEMGLIKNVFGLFVTVALIIFLSCLFFYLFGFNELSKLLIFAILSGLGIYLILKSEMRLNWQANFFAFERGQIFYLIIYFLLFVSALYLLILNQTNEAIRSPWEVLPLIFFIIYFLTSWVLVKILLFNKNNNLETKQRSLSGGQTSFVSTQALKLILLSLHFFLTWVIVVIVYKIGFGFDSFVHRAAETKLFELGYILPKPLYYIGQYTLVVWLSKILWLPIGLVDKILVPALAAIFLPATIYYSLGNILLNKKLLLVVICLLLVVATPLFFYTVPQSLANLFLLVLVFWVFKKLIDRQKIPKWYWLIGLVILLIHPLAGIPGVILLSINQRIKKSKNQKFGKVIYFIIGSLAIPLFFVLISLISNFSINFSLKNLGNLTGLFNNLFDYLPFYSVYHLVYLIEYNWLVLFILILIVGAYYLLKIKRKNLLMTSCRWLVVLSINLILLGFFEFKSVIDYEQAEFIKRLGQIIILSLSPIFLIGAYFILDRLVKLKAGGLIAGILIAGSLTISLYLAYPHVDAFEKNRGYSVSQADIKAVHLINLDGFGKDFVVLANQSTAAASLQEFGFKKYYSVNKEQLTINKEIQNLFYYPIPTSSPLYDIYLKMVYDEPKIEYINQARELTGVERVYFVINDYWLDAKKRIEQAGEIADLEINIDDKVWVFRFEQKAIDN